MKPSGHIFYQDEYQQQYHVEWKTTGGVIDFTSTIGQPFVWGKPPSGYLREGILFRRGIVTITRQVLRPFDGGYEIIAEGSSQYEDDIQMNFPCQTGPTDPFKYHLDRPLVDVVDAIVTDGPRWADPDSEDDEDMVWGDLDSSGNPVPITGATVLEFIDVWG
jgi:hypothetical protein